MAKAIKRTLDTHNNYGTIWTARTPNFSVSLVTQPCNERYDGDDQNGETQAAIDAGEMVYFDSKLVVEYDGEEIGSDYLGSSCYDSGTVSQFVKDCYFRDMLANACKEARDHVNSLPRLRAA